MEYDFCAEWLNCLLKTLENGGDRIGNLFERCAVFHYEANQMDTLLEPYIGDLQGFLGFLEKEWNWKICWSEEENVILADENKEYCVCPVTGRISGEVSPILCDCSAAFARKMFSKVCGKEVRASVKRSFLRDGKSCIYQIRL